MDYIKRHTKILPKADDRYNLRYLKYENEYSNKKNFGEVFTPTELVVYINDKIENFYPDAFCTNKTFIDPCCGNGQFLADVLHRKLDNNIDQNNAIKSIYGIDIIPEHILSTIKILYKTDDIEIIPNNSHNGLKFLFKINGVISTNFVCADSTKFNYSLLLSPFFINT